MAITNQTNVSAAVAALNVPTTTGGSLTGDNSLGQYVALTTSLNAAVAADNTAITTATNTPPQTPQTYYIEVPNVVVRLGDIALNGQTITSPSGTGVLSAPGAASITITNNTADTLDLRSLVIPSYSAGEIRANGVLVNASNDISALNAGGANANFKTVTTEANSGLVPTVTINSNYDPNSTLYYKASAPTGSPYYLTHQMVAPDVILKSGSMIDNLGGSVTINSAAGNIYVEGAIQAGSISITAKNGDFVSSYVNGFDHIGGDPASQTPTLVNQLANQEGLGIGILANGQVYIAARYLNINSTVQSGIADWSLNITPGTMLTATDPATVGISQQTVNNDIIGYQSALALGGHPSPVITLATDAAGDSLTLNMNGMNLPQDVIQGFLNAYASNPSQSIFAYTPQTVSPITGKTISGTTIYFDASSYAGSSTPGLQFSVAYANAYYAGKGGAGVYQLVGSAGNIGANYDAAAKDYEVDGTAVHGGSIQLYGQLMDTSPTSGQLNVLDGFGTIAINNTTGLAVVLANLSTGIDPSGTMRGTQGVIDITDVHTDAARIRCGSTRNTRSLSAPTSPGAATRWA